MSFTGKYSYNFEICECINDTIEEAIPIGISNFLIFIGGISELLYSPNREGKENKRNQRHADIHEKSGNNQSESNENLWNDMEHSTVSKIPNCFTGSIDYFLFFTMLEADMVVNR